MGLLNTAACEIVGAPFALYSNRKLRTVIDKCLETMVRRVNRVGDRSPTRFTAGQACEGIIHRSGTARDG